MSRHGGDWAAYRERYGRSPLDFSASISPLGLPASVRKAAADSLDDACRYPDPECRALCRGLSERYGVPQKRVVCGNGAADLIDRICRGLKPRHALLTAPTFSDYERALRASGCQVSRFSLPPETDFSLDGEAFAKTMTERTDMVFLCNPANPTGLLCGRETIRQILRRCRQTGSRLILDECFMELTGEEKACSMVRELEEWPELIILRAFTKSFAMAGLRLGYALCGSDTDAERIRHTGQSWPVSVPAQAAGLAALRETEYLKTVQELLTRERAQLINALRSLGMTVVPGKANFLLFHCSDAALGVKLCEKGIMIRDCAGEPGLCAGWFRTAVRTREENELLIRAIREVL